MVGDVNARAASRKRSELMKNLSPLLLAPILAAVLLLACTPTNAAHRGGGSAYDGTWSVAIYTLRGDCSSVRVAAQIVGGRVYSTDQSYQANGAVGANQRCQRSAFRIWLRQAIAEFGGHLEENAPAVGQPRDARAITERLREIV